ncbi:ferrous iron transport protein B [Chondromyces crocatus]|uniref:Ferrous iron transport protein B n=1 Tax=Chondromyces crocatus TaxID=52 RepID=A0A0K1EQY6_CHOCO|nr:ferrous iron transport protein B [Chondromyces crocatus]AKT43256.1 iron transporter [Chondromyces crocatus]
MTEKSLVVLVAGNPNAGKTSLFNRLTGSRAKVGNYPGVTVDRRSGVLAAEGAPKIELVDLPGTYSLTARSAEESVAVDALLGRSGPLPDAVIVVADATALRRGLYLATQVIDSGRPTVLALNMMDEARAAGHAIDVARLGEALGCEVVETVATKNQGVAELAKAAQHAVAAGKSGEGQAPVGEGEGTEEHDGASERVATEEQDPSGERMAPEEHDRSGERVVAKGHDRSGERVAAGAHERSGEYAVSRDRRGADESASTTAPRSVRKGMPEALARSLRHVEEAVRAAKLTEDPEIAWSLAMWALLSLGDDELEVPASLRAAVKAAHEEAHEDGRNLDEELVGWRYGRVDAALEGALTEARYTGESTSSRVDSVLVHPVWGLAVFAVVMLFVFQMLFAWSEPLVALIEGLVGTTQDAVRGALPEGALRDLVVDGVIAGVGNVVVFVPQIALLFAFITVLEDSGYLARVAFVIDRVMASVGLHGRAFVPMLSGFACAIPAVLATRTLESRRDRLITMLVVPLASCSARLPVYVLVTAVIFDPDTKVFGVLSVGAVVLLSMYALSVVASLGAAAVLRRTVLKGPRQPLVLELPPYRLPGVRNVAQATWFRVRDFLMAAGTVILALSIVIWGLLSYPKDGEAEARWEARRAEITETVPEGEAREEALSAAEQAQAGEALRHSAGGRLGHAIEPAIEPLGFDWRLGVGIIGAFAAREVFVSTLGIVFDVGSADEESQPLREALREAKRPDGTKLMTPLVGVSLMVFFVLACQCMSTIAVVRREAGSWKWAGLMVGYMTVLAYVASLAVYQVGRLLGLGVT